MPHADLAAAADHLGDRLQQSVHQLAQLIVTHEAVLAARYQRELARRGYLPRQRKALAAISLGALASLLRHRDFSAFFEQADYSGRRLAKLNLPPKAVVEAMRVYDELLEPLLRRHSPAHHQDLGWAREQLHFCIILTLNNAYYQVRESEAQAFFDLFSAELNFQSLEELLSGMLAALARFSRCDDAVLYLAEPDGAWTRRGQAAGNVQSASPEASGRVQQGANAKSSLPRRVAPLSSVPTLASSAPEGSLRGARRTFSGPARRKLNRPRMLRLDCTADAALLLDPSWQRRFRSCWSIPLPGEGSAAGAIQFGFTADYEWLPRELTLLSAAAERCLLAAQKAQLVHDLAAREEQVRCLANTLVEVEERERRRVSHELHDEAGQSLLCLRLQLEMLEKDLSAHPEVSNRIRDARELTERTIIEIRRLISALSPNVLEQLGLGAAVRQLVARFQQVTKIPVRLRIDLLPGLPEKMQTVLYRLAQECLHNISKHSGASRVSVSLRSSEQKVKLQVQDNGKGFDVEQALAKRDSYGLAGIRERVSLLGGDCDIRSTKGHGVRVNIELPVPPAAPTGRVPFARPPLRDASTGFFAGHKGARSTPASGKGRTANRASPAHEQATVGG
jgi:signal transduction histidine kinase